MQPMTAPDKLTDIEEKLLSALWKMKAVGQTTTGKERLQIELAPEDPKRDLSPEINNLERLGFIAANSPDTPDQISITPLGLSILRQIEEDQLQELK
jgi:hypothetical protein